MGKRLVIDIESNGLIKDMVDYSSFPYKLNSFARLWSVVIKDLDTDEDFVAENEKITREWFKTVLEDCEELIAHNGLKFDFPVLFLFGLMDYEISASKSTLYGKNCKFTDTLVLSRLYNPDRYDGHSLDSWGKRVGSHKTDFRQLCIDKGYIDKGSKKGSEFLQYCPEMTSYCITPENRVLNEDLNWVEARTLKVGENILGFDEFSDKDKSGRCYKTAKIEAISYETTDVYEVELSSGKKIKTTKEHRWLVTNENYGGNSFKWVETQNLRTLENHKNCSSVPKLFNTWEEDLSKDAGWLAGMFDGEGNISSHRFSISIAQRPTKTLEKIENLLFNKYRGVVSRRIVSKKSDCVQIILNGCAAEKLEFLGTIKPQRLINNFCFEKLGRLEARLGKEKVVRVKYVGQEEIIKIQTSTKTFICEGYPMHNCTQDTAVTKKVFFYLEREAGSHDWSEAIKQETVLAHLAVARENLGFWFDKPAAIKCVEDLTEKMNTIENAINPILPKRRMNKGEIGVYIPPKVQLKKDGSPSSAMENFTKSLGAVIEKVGTEYVFMYNEDAFILPMPQVPLKETVEADITNLDHVKMYLISLGWQPSEWRERDLTKDAKKQSLPYSKRIAALERWYEETMDGKYKEERIAYLGMDRYEILDILSEKLKDDFPVRVPTSPVVRVGIEKELCPNLLSLGEKVAFAKDFGLFLTYKHRKSTIAGGDIEDMDFDLEEPSSGFLSMYREEDGRVPTPAIEIGASTNRYRHIGVCNVARATSIYGKELRSLFGCGPGFFQYGFDFSS